MTSLRTEHSHDINALLRCLRTSLSKPVGSRFAIERLASAISDADEEYDPRASESHPGRRHGPCPVFRLLELIYVTDSSWKY